MCAAPYHTFTDASNNRLDLLTEHMKKDVVTEELNLQDVRVGPEGAMQLSRHLSLAAFATLKRLNLSATGLRDEGLLALLGTVQCSQCLHSMNLSYNGISCDGAERLAMALLHNACLSELNLRGNDVGDPGAEMIAGMLVANCSLTDLNLSVNAIGDSGASAFGDVLSIHPEYGLANSTLLCLNLSGNYNLSSKGRSILEKAHADRQWGWRKERVLWIAAREVGTVWYRLMAEEVENVLHHCRKSLRCILAAPPKLSDDPAPR